MKKNYFNYCDAHFHYVDCLKNSKFVESSCYKACSTALNVEEWKILQGAPEYIKKSYGIHPYDTLKSDFDCLSQLDFLESLLREDRICAIGESGLDFFTSELKETKNIQIDLFNSIIELAIKYKKGIIIHGRKSNGELLSFSTKLKNLPFVIFHSFMGNSIEGKMFLNHEINGFFSFGPSLFNFGKKSVDCFINLPIENLLLETDYPFGKFMGLNEQTNLSIVELYKKSFYLRKDFNDLNEFGLRMEQNFSILNL